MVQQLFHYITGKTLFCNRTIWISKWYLAELVALHLFDHLRLSRHIDINMLSIMCVDLLSSSQNINTGVLQGSILSSLRFLFYINILQHVNNDFNDF